MTEYMVSYREKNAGKMVFVKITGETTDKVAEKAQERFSIGSLTVRTKRNHGHYAWITKYSNEDDFYRNVNWYNLP